MKESIRHIKKLVSNLESYIYLDNKDMIADISDDIINSVSKLKSSVLDDGKSNPSQNDFEDTRLNIISTMDFLYKPVTQKNYYEGDYLERFSDERTQELSSSKALELHDRFWTSNGVEKGNIFGSIPRDLISKNSRDKLISYGWKNSEVNIYEVDSGLSLDEVSKICKNRFGSFLIVKEMRNKALLVLEYKNI